MEAITNSSKYSFQVFFSCLLGMHSTIEKLTLGWMIGGCSTFSNAIDVAQLLYHTSLKTATLVGKKSGRTPVMDKLVLHEKGRCSPCYLVFCGHSDGKPGEHISEDQNILIPSNGWL